MSFLTLQSLLENAEHGVPIPGTEEEIIRHVLREIVQHFDLDTACRKVGVSRGWLDAFAEVNEGVAEALATAQKYAIDRLEGSAFKRATDGISEPVINKKGEVVGEKVKYSDSLAQFFLAAHRPEKYKEANAKGALLIPFVADVPATASRDQWKSSAGSQNMPKAIDK